MKCYKNKITGCGYHKPIKEMRIYYTEDIPLKMMEDVARYLCFNYFKIEKNVEIPDYIDDDHIVVLETVNNWGKFEYKKPILKSLKLEMEEED